MNAVDRLRRDHKILRAKLNVLESALGMGAETWYVLREVCFTLARQLRDHMKREEALVMACRNPKVLADIAMEHRDEPEHLRAINRLFAQEKTQVLDRIGPALQAVIQGLRRHMDEEEAELFPLLERQIASLAPPATARAAQGVDECMTVNRVVHEYPATHRIFEQLFINVPIEGSTCLDEVAWRHGMESRELLKQLEAAIQEKRPTPQTTDTPELVCHCP